MIRVAGSEAIGPEKRQGNGQGATKQSALRASEPVPGMGDYQAVIEMARKGMSENEIMEKSELTEAEISLFLELGRKRNEFN